MASPERSRSSSRGRLPGGRFDRSALLDPGPPAEGLRASTGPGTSPAWRRSSLDCSISSSQSEPTSDRRISQTLVVRDLAHRRGGPDIVVCETIREPSGLRCRRATYSCNRTIAAKLSQSIALCSPRARRGRAGTARAARPRDARRDRALEARARVRGGPRSGALERTSRGREARASGCADRGSGRVRTLDRQHALACSGR
jgi:hypothetical protein